MLKEEIKAELDELNAGLNEPLTDESSKAVMIRRIADLEATLKAYKSFDRKKFIENYKALLAKTGVKISRIEYEAGVSQGYFSRLDKEDSTQDPSIEFICACAKMFDVSVDFLLNGTVTEMTETEAFIASFADSLIDDTMNDSINWTEVPDYDGEPISDMEADTFDHPMYYLYSEDINPPYTNQTVKYYSRFNNKATLSKEHPSFTAVLPNTQDKIFFMGTKYDEDVVYEMYLEVGESVNSVCNTKVVCETVRQKLRILYTEILKSGKRVHISGTAVNSISNYMKKRSKGV